MFCQQKSVDSSEWEMSDDIFEQNRTVYLKSCLQLFKLYVCISHREKNVTIQLYEFVTLPVRQKGVPILLLFKKTTKIRS